MPSVGLIFEIQEIYDRKKRSQSPASQIDHSWPSRDKSHESGYDDEQPRCPVPDSKVLISNDSGDECDAARNRQDHIQPVVSSQPQAQNLRWDGIVLSTSEQPTLISNYKVSFYSHSALRQAQKNAWDKLSSKEKAGVLEKMAVHACLDALDGMSTIERKEILKNISSERLGEMLQFKNQISAKL